ncbi:hypothetical protein OSB04_004777 [Centaurea solstitialis]|uniref:Uncharacterized protein n=1 Tax=Centaurea solstitialis TaxID=347529 RepID=A0AA38TXR9_9ASTR|nr:hypothetical protein OSB04_004777 [Centaurea solstitialis]
MESRSRVLAKKVWSVVRVMSFMLKKNAKQKFRHLNKMVKRVKIAGKASHNPMFYNHHHNRVKKMGSRSRVTAKKVWSVVRVMFFMLKINANRKFLHLNMMVKRVKIAGKALRNLMFHHHRNRVSSITSHNTSPSPLHQANTDSAVATPTSSNIMIPKSTTSPPLPGMRAYRWLTLRIKDSQIVLISHGDKDDRVDEPA